MTKGSATIYVELLDEGVDVWRPVTATEIRPGGYLLQGPVPVGERWAFEAGSIVECELRRMS